jgi:ribonucleoside-triphosphate reductase
MTSNLESSFQELIYLRSYARWMPDNKRRETWPETVNRYFDFFEGRVPEVLSKEWELARQAVLKHEVLPSMRALWAAGETARRENVAIYNCAYTPIDSVRRFAEILYILIHGTGAGFSVEQKYVDKLPVVRAFQPVNELIEFQDSRLGWAEGYLRYISALFEGKVCETDLTRIRRSGAPLLTSGGRACGAEALEALLKKTYAIIAGAQNRKLTSLESHDLACTLAETLAKGGVRSSSLLSLSGLSDKSMRNAKTGKFWIEASQRRFANNSAVYTEPPSEEEFWEEWTSLINSGTGERGFFNREGCRQSTIRTGRRKAEFEFGTNPCSEIILRPQQFCNLSEVVCRPHDTLDSLHRKVRIATLIGVIQSLMTEFQFLSEEWKRNCEEERLLGVSLTGTCDHPVLCGSDLAELGIWLRDLKQSAIEAARRYSQTLCVNMPVALTCVKPSGTVSQLINSSSGLHPRFSRYYIRRVRLSYLDPLCQFLISKGVPHHPEIGQNWQSWTEMVFDFPFQSPRKSVCRDQCSAIQMLEYIKVFQSHWCEHKPSATVYVKAHEWREVGEWIRTNWELSTGVSFFPFDNGTYELAPFEAISADQFEKRVKEFPPLDFTELRERETEDRTMGAAEAACSADACEMSI